jgi:hypothetical protein
MAATFMPYSGPGAGKFRAGHQVIHERQHAVEAVVDGVDIHRDRNAVLVRDACGARYRRGIVAVDMQQARAGDLLRSNLLRLESETLGAAPEHRALAAGAVDNNVGRLIGATLAALHVVEVDAGGLQAGPLGIAALIVPDGADILGAQSQAGASHHGAGHLATRADGFPLEGRFAGVRRKSRHDEQRVGSIQAYTHNVEISH